MSFFLRLFTKTMIKESAGFLSPRLLYGFGKGPLSQREAFRHKSGVLCRHKADRERLAHIHNETIKNIDKNWLVHF